MITRGLTAAVIAVAVLAPAGCSDGDQPPANASPTSSSSPPATTTTPKPQTPEEKAKAAALEVYRASWEATARAGAQPRARDWRPVLGKYFGPPALETMLIDIKDYAKWPAHEAGHARPLSPKVVKVKSNSRRPHTVIIEDCIDASEYRVVSDRAGEKGKDLTDPNQPDRYRFEARLAWYPKPKIWRVYQQEARLEEPC